MTTKPRLIAAALLSLASFAASINLLFAALVRMGMEFGVRPELLASISAIYFSCFAVISVLAGYLSDRYGAKAVLLAGCCSTCAGGLVLTAGQGSPALVLGCIALGTGGGVIEGMSSALLTRLFPDRERFALNLSQAGYCFGAVAGPLAMGFLLPHGVNWRIFFLPVALLAVANFILFLTSTFPVAERPQATAAPLTPATVWRWSVIQLCLVLFLYVLAESSLAGFINIFLFQYRGAPEEIAIQSISYFWGIMLIGRVVASLLPARLPNHVLIAGMMVFAAAALALSLLTASWVVFLLALLAASFLMAGAWPTAVALVATRHPDAVSTVVGIVVASGSLGCIISPLIMGRFFLVLDPTLTMALPAVPLLAGGVLALIGPARTMNLTLTSPSDNI